MRWDERGTAERENKMATTPASVKPTILEIPPTKIGEGFGIPGRSAGAIPGGKVSGSVRPAVTGRFLSVEGRRFLVKGVTYGTFSPNEQGEPFPSPDRVKQDFFRMSELGINTVRLYTPPPDWVADAAW